ncbi:MAG: oligosaccharide flippase family protein [Proteobacteria bacterium]|nr:oligosaccharide flippase family protein [Pseudomonadota bacterium]
MRNLFRALLKADGGGIFGQAMSAGFWAAALRIILRFSMIIRTIILARILAPDDFGLMAIATLAIALLERFTQSGFESALVQQSDDIEPYLNTAWTLQIVRALSMAGVLALAAPLIAGFFNAPEAVAVLQVMAIAVAIKGFQNIAVVTFIKELQFDKYFILQIVSRGTEIIVSITAALILRNVWALVIGVVAGSVARFIVSYLIHDYRPRIRWVWSQVKQLFNFGKWILLNQILGYASSNLDDIFVGRLLGVQALGFYRMAFNFSQAVATEVTQVTNQVAFPTYSKLQNAAGKLRNAYMGTVHLVAFLGFPIAIGTVLVAPDLTYGLLGDKWAPIIVPMQLLSVSGLVRGIAATAGPLFQSQGRPDIPPRYTFAKFVMMAVFLYPAINAYGISGAALVIVLSGFITGTSALWLSFRFVKATRPQLKQALGFPFLNTAFMTIVVLGVRFAFFDEPTVVSFAVLVVTGGLAYLAAVTASTRIIGYAAPSDLLKRVRGVIA